MAIAGRERAGPVQWQEAATHALAAFALSAAFPRLAHRLRWPTRLGPRGLLAYIALNTALGFGLRAWVAPYFRRLAEERERLAAKLGREPTVEEVADHFGWDLE